jgi:CRP-like cAMP-binding protein
MAKQDPGKLKDQAAKFLKKGKMDKALETYLELEKVAKDDLRIPQKTAEIMLKMGQKAEAVAKYKESAERYREKGFLVQAIAIYKVILELAPDDASAKESLSTLCEERAGPLPGVKKQAEESPQPMPPLPPRKAPRPAPPRAIVPEPPAAEEKPAEELPEEEPAAPEAEAAEPELGIPLDESGTEPSAADDAQNLELSVEDEDRAVAALAPEEEEAGEEVPLAGAEVEVELGDTVVPVEEEEELPPAGPEKTPLFSELEPGEFERVFELLASRVIEKGQTVVKEGEPGDSIFIIARGKFTVTRTCADRKKEAAVLGPGEFFGEIGYFHGLRTATVTAMMKSLILEMAKPDLDRVVEEFPRVKEVLARFYRERVMENLMADSPLFGGLVPPERDRVREKFRYREIRRGEVIVKEGDPGDSMFLIKSGEFTVQTLNEITKKPVELARLKGGDFFGEVSLVKNKPRTATVVADTEAEVMELKRQDFAAIAKSHPEIASALEHTIEQRVEDTIKKMVEAMEK